MALNFKEAEEKLHQLIENDRSDENIYILLHDITFNYLFNVLNPGSIYYDYEVISWDLAADLFLRIRNGAKIDHYIGYISHILKMYYLRNYEKENWSIIIDTSNDHKLKNAIEVSCIGNRNNDYVKLENLLTGIYFTQFETILNDVIKSSKFEYISKNRLNLQISILLTLLKGQYTYFRLPEDIKPYVGVLIVQIKNKLMLEGICDRDNLITAKSTANNESYIELT